MTKYYIMITCSVSEARRGGVIDPKNTHHSTMNNINQTDTSRGKPNVDEIGRVSPNSTSIATIYVKTCMYMSQIRHKDNQSNVVRLMVVYSNNM